MRLSNWHCKQNSRIARLVASANNPSTDSAHLTMCAPRQDDSFDIGAIAEHLPWRARWIRAHRGLSAL